MKHGTSGAYTNHGCRCDECRTAHAAKMREYRAKTGDENGKRERQSRNRAYRVVARMHPDEFAAILDAEREKVGLPPVGQLPVGRPAA